MSVYDVANVISAMTFNLISILHVKGNGKFKPLLHFKRQLSPHVLVTRVKFDLLSNV